MQGKFKIKKNNIKISTKKSSGDTNNQSIARKTFTDGVRINLITSHMVDTSNSHRVMSPIQAQQKKDRLSDSVAKGKKRKAL